MGTSGVGSPSHVAGVLMENMLGLHWQMVSYRSAGLATQDLVAGITDIQLDTPAVSLPHVQSGALKAYAVTAKKRIAVAPDIPTTDEAGLPGYYFSFWHAMWAPKGTPKEIVAKLNAAAVAALADPETRKRLTDLAQEIYPREQQTPEALHAFQKAEIEKWWPIIKAAGIKARVMRLILSRDSGTGALIATDRAAGFLWRSLSRVSSPRGGRSRNRPPRRSSHGDRRHGRQRRRPPRL